MIYKSFKFKIYPTEEQKELIRKTFGCVRFIYNKMLSDKIEYYKKTGKFLNNTPAQYKNEFPWLKNVDSYALLNAQLNLLKAFKNFTRNKNLHNFPKFKSKKKSKLRYTTNNCKNAIAFFDGKIKLPKFTEGIKINVHRKIPDNFVLKNVTISESKTGNFYASILFSCETSVPVKYNFENFYGIDFRGNDLCVGSDGNTIPIPDNIKKAEDKTKKEFLRMKKMKINSKNFKKQKLILLKAYEKLVNKRHDFIHKASRQIANAYDCVFVPDFSVEKLSKCLKLNYTGWGLFVFLLDYKLKENGGRLVKIKTAISNKTSYNINDAYGNAATACLIRDRGISSLS